MLDIILNYIKDNFSRKRAFLLGLVALLIFFASVDNFTEKIISDHLFRFILYLVICIIWPIYWLYRRNHFPKNKKGYIGIVVCVESENDKQKNRLKNDFVKRIRELIAQSNLRNFINLILLTNYQAEYAIRVLEEYVKNKNKKEANAEWKKIRKRTQGHFFIYGGIKERQDEVNKYFLNLEALVIHAPVQFPTQNQIVQEFLSVWYKQISFQEKIEFNGFLFAADSIFIAVQYIVGIAALVSGDIVLALELHTNLNNDPYFLRFNPLPPNLQNVKIKLKALLVEENFLIAKSFCNQQLFSDADKYAERSLSIEPNYGAYLLKSIIEFSYKSKPEEALKYVHRARELADNEGTWRYNEGFLLMHLEKFEDALKVYYKIANTSYMGEENTLIEVYKFNEEFLKKHPKNIQCYFIIGFLKYKKESNYPDSLQYFEKFILACASRDTCRILQGKAEEYRVELENIMGLNVTRRFI